MTRRLLAFLVSTLALVPGAAHAYVGPGAGLSLIGAFWAVVVALAAVLFFVIAWPIRRMLRRNRTAAHPDSEPPAPSGDGSPAQGD